MRLTTVLAVVCVAIPFLATAGPTTAVGPFYEVQGSEIAQAKGGGSKGGGSKGGRGPGRDKDGDSSPSKSSSPDSNVGGRTTTGTGPRPAYGGGGKYYGGGAAVPYSAGSVSPGGLRPLLVGLGGVVVFGAIIHAMTFPLWLYAWPDPYRFYNATLAANETKNVLCGCAQYQVCGCDRPGDDTYLAGIIGDGSWARLNKSLVSVAAYEGNQTIFIDGTLPNGTTAAGGTDDPNDARRNGGALLGGMFAAAAAALLWMYL